MYQPHLARKFKLKLFRMEIDRKNGAVLMSILPGQIEKHIIFKKQHNFSKSFFSKKFSYKCIPVIVAAAAAAAAATKKTKKIRIRTRIRIRKIIKIRIKVSPQTLEVGLFSERHPF